jgi:uncharacterized Zn finger protein
MSKKKKKYAARTPLGVKGGIRAQTAHGWHARVWWSRRWTEVMESFRLGARLGRGRNYAVSGQVSELSVEAGRVTACVQGSSSEPYASEIRFRCLSGESKARAVRALNAQPVLLARLLVGDLPHEVEEVFQKEGCPLFPQRASDLQSRCSCPDWANPCKHLAAVYYLIGEAIAKRPLLLLALRGVGRADLVGEPAPDDEAGREAAGAPEPLSAEAFYGTPKAEFRDFGEAAKTAVSAPLIQRLGPLQFWRGQERFVDTLEHLYARAAPRGWAVWTGEQLDLRREDEKVVITGANLHLRHRKMRVDASWT